VPGFPPVNPQLPIIPPAAIPPVLAAPSIAAAAGAAVTLGIAAGTPVPAPDAPPGAAPSEFTRVLKGVAAPAAVGAAVTGAAIVAQKKKDEKAGRAGPSIVPLVIGLNVVVIAAIALILYFVLSN
jgi:hypothetical protein